MVLSPAEWVPGDPWHTLQACSRAHAGSRPPNAWLFLASASRSLKPTQRQGRPLPGAADTSARCDLRVPLGRLYLRPGGTLGLGGDIRRGRGAYMSRRRNFPDSRAFLTPVFMGAGSLQDSVPRLTTRSLQMQTKSRNAKVTVRGRRQKSRLQTDWPASSTPPGSALLLGCQWPALRHGEGPSG